MPDEAVTKEVPAPAVSPTGLAILPQGLLKVVAAFVALAASALTVLPMLPDAPWVKTATTVATAVIALGSLVGITSQGIRKTGEAAAAKVTTVDEALREINK